MSDRPVSNQLELPKDTFMHRLAWLGVGIFVLLLVWISIGKLDVVSMAIGQVVPASQVKQVQHLEGGIVSEILVSEGQVVKKGQKLVILEPTRSKAEVDELTLRIAALQTDIVRLDAEAALQDDLRFSSELAEHHPELIEKSVALFRVRQERLNADIAVQTKSIEEKQQTIAEVEARLKKSKTLLGYITEQVKISDKLLASNLSNRMKHLELLRQSADMEGDISIFEASLGRAHSTLEEAQARLVSIRSSFLEEARAERAKKFRSLRELSERLVRVQDSLLRTVLRAPVDGIIKTLHVATEGGVVRPASTVLELVPTGDKLIIEAKLAIQDIGFVRVGDQAQLQLASPDAQLFDKLTGQVTHISPDTLITEKGAAFYKIRVETEQAFFESGQQRYQLYPGMQVQSSIVTGKRSILDYILSPILQSADSALQER